MPIVAHNASFDAKFRDSELARIRRSRKQDFVCSLLLSRRLLPSEPSLKLGVLVEYADLPVAGRYHRALADAEMAAIRAQGAGGQNVNKVSNAVHLRFDIAASSLPENIRTRLLALRDHQISKEGVVIIKAQKFRSLEKNRAEALRRLEELIERVAAPPKARRPTRPTRASITCRLERKAKRASIKAMRGRGNDGAVGV